MEGFCCIVVVGIIVAIIVIIATSRSGSDGETKISSTLTEKDLKKLQEEEERNRKKQQTQNDWDRQVEQEYSKNLKKQLGLSSIISANTSGFWAAIRAYFNNNSIDYTYTYARLEERINEIENATKQLTSTIIT